ncbi:MAG: hypothetical protein IJN25_07205 [Clostridia bacterium]|nr:hypothetical protein [Clostridia bacterium]
MYKAGIAPGSLCCRTCPSMQSGVIAETAGKLRHYPEGYYAFCRDDFPDYAKEIKTFTERLEKKKWRKAGR